MTASAHVVPGEDAPLGVLLVTGAVGLACAAATLAALAQADEPRPGAGANLPSTTTGVAAVMPAPAPRPEPAAPPMPTPTAAADGPATDGGAAGCPDVVLHFAAGQAELGPAEAQAAAAIAAWMNSYPDGRVELDGHASASGGELANLRLSRRRAGAVVRVLDAAGVPPGRALVRGFGAYVPADDPAPEASAHRRVVIRLRGGPRARAACPSSPAPPAIEEP